MSTEADGASTGARSTATSGVAAALGLAAALGAAFTGSGSGSGSGGRCALACGFTAASNTNAMRDPRQSTRACYHTLNIGAQCTPLSTSPTSGHGTRPKPPAVISHVHSAVAHVPRLVRDRRDGLHSRLAGMHAGRRREAALGALHARALRRVLALAALRRARRVDDRRRLLHRDRRALVGRLLRVCTRGASQRDRDADSYVPRHVDIHGFTNGRPRPSPSRRRRKRQRSRRPDRSHASKVTLRETASSRSPIATIPVTRHRKEGRGRLRAT